MCAERASLPSPDWQEPGAAAVVAALRLHNRDAGRVRSPSAGPEKLLASASGPGSPRASRGARSPQPRLKCVCFFLLLFFGGSLAFCSSQGGEDLSLTEMHQKKRLS